jgi:sugar lactone lactonase YvrE
MHRLLAIPLFLAATSLASAQALITPVCGVTGAAGFRDGIGSAAIFNDPMGIARDSQGNVFVCDARSHVIRKITAAGVVTTLAGRPGVEGAANGVAGKARFRFPVDIAVSPNGDLYVADSGNHCIRKVKPNGTVSTVAGKLGSANDVTTNYGTANYTIVPAALDGKGGAARFNAPSGIAFAGDCLYVSDTGNHTVRRIDLKTSQVTTLAGKPGEWGAVDGAGTTALFNSPMGLCLGTDGSLYIADSQNHTIRCVTPLGVVTTYSGAATEQGIKTGPRLDARYSLPVDICVHPNGGFIVCDSFANTLCRIEADGLVSLLAGGIAATPQPGSLANPSSAVCDALGNVFIADTFNQEIRLASPNPK